MMSQVAISNNEETEIERIESQVKWYNAEIGYGFLMPGDGTSDIFMHFSVLDMAGCHRVEEGDRIVCEIGPGRRGRQVLRVLEVKFAPREHRTIPSTMPRSLDFDPTTLEEVRGHIKWFNPLKGFGFVFPDGGGRDIFLHASVLRSAGFESLEPGIRVEIKVSTSEKGREARILKIEGRKEE